jgi:hypothetical protein
MAQFAPARGQIGPFFYELGPSQSPAHLSAREKMSLLAYFTLTGEFRTRFSQPPQKNHL